MRIDRAKFLAACREIERPQAWVALKAGISKQRLWNYVAGRDCVPQPIYLRLVGILGTPDLLADQTEAVAA